MLLGLLSVVGLAGLVRRGTSSPIIPELVGAQESWQLPLDTLEEGLHITYRHYLRGIRGYFKRGEEIIHFETRRQYFHLGTLVFAWRLVGTSSALRDAKGRIFRANYAMDPPPGWPKEPPKALKLDGVQSDFAPAFYASLQHYDMGLFHYNDLFSVTSMLLMLKVKGAVYPKGWIHG